MININPKKDSRLLLRAALLALVILLCYISCTVRTEPGKVWQTRAKIIALSESLTGLTYRYGGEDIDGFDCSGLVYYIYDCFGIQVPRTAKKQAKLKPKIKLRRAKPGDILIFKLKRRGWHSAILIDKNHFIHAPKKNDPVRKEVLNSYWRSHLKAVINKIDQ